MPINLGLLENITISIWHYAFEVWSDTHYNSISKGVFVKLFRQVECIFRKICIWIV
jgi:hypothetical protein